MRIDRETLLPLTQHAAACASTAENISGCALLTVAHDRVTIAGTDYDVTGSAVADCDASDEWALAVPASRLARLIGALPTGATVELTPMDGQRLAVSAGRSKYVLAGFDASEFPEVKPAKGDLLEMPCDELALLLVRSAYCVSSNEARPALCGLYLEAADGTLTVVATDGHRLALAAMPVGGPPFTAILPRRQLTVLRDMVAAGGTVGLSHDGHNLCWSVGWATVVARKIDATYPDYRKVLPDPARHWPLLATVDSGALLAELARVVTMAPKLDAVVTLTWTAQGLALDCRSEGGAAHAECDADVIHNGGDLTAVTLNPAYLRDALKTLGGTVTIGVVDGTTPVKVTSDAALGAVVVLMPCRT